MAIARKHSLLYTFITFLSLLISRKPHLALGMSAITANQTLAGDQKLTSAKGKFVLGFFKPGNASNNWYIGIWFGNISQQTVIWVANREEPVTNAGASKLVISSDGNLVLLNQNRTIVWSTHTKNASFDSTEAVMLDTGNLVLRNRSNTSIVLWQSFDHLTHAWLPGSKLGLNKITGVNQNLISWKDENNPSPGLFSFQLDPKEQEFFLWWHNSITYWRSGKWQGNFFENAPEMGSYENTYITFNFTNDETGFYLTYWVLDDSIISGNIMSISGQLQSLIWNKFAEQWSIPTAQPKDQCSVYNLCGSFGSCIDNNLHTCQCIKGFTEKNPVNWGSGDYSGGCIRKNPLQCTQNGSTKGKKDRFYKLNNMVLPNNFKSFEIDNLKDCEIACSNNCSCTAYAYNNGCSLWYGDLVNLKDNGGETFYLRLAASEVPTTSRKKRTIVIVSIAGLFLFLFLTFLLFPIIRKWWRLRSMKISRGTLSAFTYQDLVYITKNFSETLGKGGFGSVYKGTLPNSTVVAVKRLRDINQSDKSFRAEVSTIGNIQHFNLIRLLGFCCEKGRKLLVYEYMPMGSLDKHLFGSASLTWKIRYQIALGISRGLLYLHDECRDCIIHCDIKPENILLNESFVPKIADFGLAKLLGREFSRVLTSMRGTVGYLAPEWIAGSAITTKADVYSYGMMLFEIISGKRNRKEGDDLGDASQEEEGNLSFFPAFAANKLVEGDIHCLLDLMSVDDCNLEELERAVKVALWCVQIEEDLRPSMRQVVQMLEGQFNVNMPPIPRPFQVLTEMPDSINFFSITTSKTPAVKVPMSTLDE
ncbi:hypothetical protein LUZ61_005407 [Rhynchospora tenuis]|uniref:Receptor-like serine/threonine-protein kinase n=1 Tax=Rhynchospora tenuis TaxID=198213 RepID=A0AAD5ZPK6_9POAL|nr:hypothetical protein LUZ61_005407 [Rhynchospora tenuis]